MWGSRVKVKRSEKSSLGERGNEVLSQAMSPIDKRVIECLFPEEKWGKLLVYITPYIRNELGRNKIFVTQRSTRRVHLMDSPSPCENSRFFCHLRFNSASLHTYSTIRSFFLLLSWRFDDIWYGHWFYSLKIIFRAFPRVFLLYLELL